MTPLPILFSRYRTAIMAVAAVLLLAVLAWAIYSVCHALWNSGYNYASARKDAEIAQLKASHATALASAVTAAARKHEQDARLKSEKETQLLHDKRALESQRDFLQQKLRERMARASKQPLPQFPSTAQAAAVCLPAPVFTADWLCDYNAALGLPGDQTCALASTPDRETGAASTAGAGLRLWLQDSGVTADDVLAHAIDYGFYCRGLSTQVNRLIDLLETQNRETHNGNTP